MSADTFRERPHILGLITLVGRILQEETGKRMMHLDLTYAQAVALVRLWRTEDGHLRQTEMIESLALSRAAGTQLLNDLEFRGFINRSIDPSDGRRQVIDLTERGREMEAPTLKVFDAVEGAAISRISKSDWETTQGALSRMLLNLVEQ